MMRVLKPEDVIYKLSIDNMDLNRKVDTLCEYRDIYGKIKNVLSIDRGNFNIYLVDDYSKEKVEHLRSYIEEIYKLKQVPKDICYVVYEDDRNPTPLILKGGVGNKLKKTIEDLQEKVSQGIYKFYSSSTFEEKEDILDALHRERAKLVEELVNKAKEEGFEIKATTNGFAFLPLKEEGETMSTKEYEELDLLIKEDILSKVSKLKIHAEEVLEKLKELEDYSNEGVKILLRDYLSDIFKEDKDKYINRLKDDENAIEYLSWISTNMMKEIIDIYSGTYDDDEDKLSTAVLKYNVNVLVDNSKSEHPKVYFEENPTLDNLIGEIRYESQGSNYVTDISMISAGSLLKCNEGVIILRLIDLINNPGAYNQLKKALLRNKVNFTTNKGYLELLSLSSLQTEDIDINVKVVVIGDMENYDILYAYDEDFKRVFSTKVESNPVVDINEEGKSAFLERVNYILDTNKLFDMTNDGLKELGKHLSRLVEDNRKLLIDEHSISKILNLAHVKSIKDNRALIDGKQIKDIVYERDNIEKEILKMYEDKSILIHVKGEEVGSINALSVISTGYLSFGRPMRLTGVCYKGSGSIIDVQKESKLSGSIHEKSLNILKAYLMKITNPYKGIPVDFHLSFEQIYGKIDGDSASVAETICMISSLSKIPIKQNIAVTGSINQFGEVQPIGGVNEKIEGFFNVCKILDTFEGKGVLIPESNVNNLVLNEEVEDAIQKGLFKLYTMETMVDAIDILMGNDVLKAEEILKTLNEEAKKYDTDNEKENAK